MTQHSYYQGTHSSETLEFKVLQRRFQRQGLSDDPSMRTTHILKDTPTHY